MEYTVIDFETANASRNSACALGIIHVVDNDIVYINKFLLHPLPFEFEERNIFIHGLTPDMCANAPTFADIFSEILPYIDGQLLVAHYASFDISVLKCTAEYQGVSLPRFSVLDTIPVAKIAFPGQDNYKLKTLCSFLDISLNHHDPLSDAIACNEILSRAIHDEDIELFCARNHIALEHYVPSDMPDAETVSPQTFSDSSDNYVQSSPDTSSAILEKPDNFTPNNTSNSCPRDDTLRFETPLCPICYTVSTKGASNCSNCGFEFHSDLFNAFRLSKLLQFYTTCFATAILVFFISFGIAVSGGYYSATVTALISFSISIIFGTLLSSRIATSIKKQHDLRIYRQRELYTKLSGERNKYPAATYFILNTSSNVLHLPSCPSAPSSSYNSLHLDYNAPWHGIKYTPCKRCLGSCYLSRNAETTEMHDDFM